MSIEFLHSGMYGMIRYFESDRCFNTEKIKGFNQYKIACDEIVSFDCGLFAMREIDNLDVHLNPKTKQIIAVIVRPGIEPATGLLRSGFTFCGYDLVEDFSTISAITDCGGGFSCIPYENLTEFGLLPTYKDAILTQLALVEEAPDECHAYCDVCEIWRKLV